MTSLPSTSHVRGRASLVVLLVVLAVLVTGCEPPTPPDEAAQQYTQLMQVAASQAKARPDTSFFWLRNTGNARARTLMLDLGVDFLYYDRSAGVLCVWSGEGLWPARGYVTAIPSATPQTDSVGVLCDIEGECTASPITETWARFRCQ